MTDWLHPEMFKVDTGEGELSVARWGGSGPVVLGIHGITASHAEWPYLARDLGDDVTFIAPDLRGRGGSREAGPPYGFNAHADDCAAILDHLGVEEALVIGHSMGAYVAATFAMHYPDRVNNLILADGGFTLATPAPDVDIKQLLDVVLGPSIQRCSMKFASVQDYIEFWKQHPAFQKEDAWNEVLQEFVVYDLMGEVPELHSKITLEAIYVDGRDTLLHEDLHIAVDKIPCPILLIRAPRGILDQPEGLYSDEVAAELVAKHPNLTDVLIDDVNHWTLLISERGAHEVGDLIRPLLPTGG